MTIVTNHMRTAIRIRWAAGEPLSVIAADLGIHYNTARRHSSDLTRASMQKHEAATYERKRQDPVRVERQRTYSREYWRRNNLTDTSITG